MFLKHNEHFLYSTIMKKTLLTILASATLFTACNKTETTDEKPQENTTPQVTVPPSANTGTEIGQTAPEIVMNSPEGKSVALSSFRGKTVVIDFWATWCPPCRKSIPYVKETYEKYKNNNVVFLGVSLDKAEGLDGWKEYIKENGMDWVQVADGKFWDNAAAVAYGIESIPSIWVLDREGKIVGKNLFHDELEATITKAIQQ